jgi:hypothetical protein
VKIRHVVPIAVLLAALVGCASSQRATPPNRCVRTSSGQALHGGLDKVVRLTNILRAAEAYANKHFGYYFAGIAVNCDATGLDIYRRPGSALDSSVRPYLAGVSATFHDARFSKKQLDDVAARITADTDYWQARHITIDGATADLIGSGVVVEVSDPNAARKPLEDAYGSSVLRIVKPGSPIALSNDAASPVPSR